MSLLVLAGIERDRKGARSMSIPVLACHPLQRKAPSGCRELEMWGGGPHERLTATVSSTSPQMCHAVMRAKQRTTRL